MDWIAVLFNKLFDEIKERFDSTVDEYGKFKTFLFFIGGISLALIQWSLTLFIGYTLITVIPWSAMVKVIFLTKDNQLNGVGTASAISVLLLIVNVWDARRRAKMDLLAKSRIEWMKTVRPLIANYVTHVSKYIYLYRVFIFSTNNQTKREKHKELTEKMEQIKTEYYQILLYVPDNQSNELLLRNIRNLYGEINNIRRYYRRGLKSGKVKAEQTQEQIIVNKYISGLINKTIDEGGIYFKREWERAKKGK